MPLVIVRYPKRQIRSLQYFLQEKNNLVSGGIFFSAFGLLLRCLTGCSYG